MKFKGLLVPIVGAALLLSSGVAYAAAPLSVTCVGVPSATNITWSASSADGVAPVAYLWGNGSTSPMQVIAEPPGTYSMDIQATDASSTVATSTCSATVVAPPTGTSNAQLQAQIKSIMAQIAALNAQLKQLLLQQIQQNAGTATTTCSRFARNLMMGDDGDDVAELQRTLSSDPSLLPPGLVTGHFGPMTKLALQKYQRKFGIASSSTGFFGPLTRGFLVSQCELERHRNNQNASSTVSAGMMGNKGEHKGNDR
jgi:peptidoglycan hydrolase-like protein with peptidoglycan-binding domain